MVVESSLSNQATRAHLYCIFDALERDLNVHLEQIESAAGKSVLNEKEFQAAQANIRRNRERVVFDEAHIDEKCGLNMIEKVDIILRNRHLTSDAVYNFFRRFRSEMSVAIDVRNSLMHGRPLLVTELDIGIRFVSSLSEAPNMWPHVMEALNAIKSGKLNDKRNTFSLIQLTRAPSVVNNLPEPDYNETGFFPRVKLQKEILDKLKKRHPVLTILGEGGNGKTALVLKVLYDMISLNEADWDFVIWVTAKNNEWAGDGVKKIDDAIMSSYEAMSKVASLLDDQTDMEPFERVRTLMSEARVLLVIDNLETIIDSNLRKFAEDIPGDSKLILTSRVPLGSDLTVKVDAFSFEEARDFLSRYISNFSISALKNISEGQLKSYLSRLQYRPLLIKWFALACAKGALPENVLRNESAKEIVRFCIENVVDKLEPAAASVLEVFAASNGRMSLNFAWHVSKLPVDTIIEGANQLLYFGILEAEQGGGSEFYRLRPLVHSYLVRVQNGLDSRRISEMKDEIARLLARFRFAKSNEWSSAENWMSSYCFDVSDNEAKMLASSLRKVVFLIDRNDYVAAGISLDEVERLVPNSIDCRRVRALWHERQGEIDRAGALYDELLDEKDLPGYIFYQYCRFVVYNGWRTDRFDDVRRRALSINFVGIFEMIFRRAVLAEDWSAAKKCIEDCRTFGTVSNHDRSFVLRAMSEFSLRRLGAKLDLVLNQDKFVANSVLLGLMECCSMLPDIISAEAEQFSEGDTNFSVVRLLRAFKARFGGSRSRKDSDIDAVLDGVEGLLEMYQFR